MLRIFIILVVSVLFSLHSFAQLQTENGSDINPHGHIRILLVFVEIQYPDGDKFPPDAQSEWKTGEYPIWANSLFEYSSGSDPNAMVSRFYRESSFGDFQVSGDILLDPVNPDRPFQFKSNGSISPGEIIKEAWEKGFTTLHSLPADSFDLWEKGKSGQLKELKNPESELSFDHIMFIVRNCTYPSNLGGYASPGTIRTGGVVRSDSYSVFATRNVSPLHILLHEFNHLLFGGNNQHCCGGNHIGSGPQMFLSFEGGWGMMGSANKSLMTCNAYDRYRLAWKAPEKEFYISAHDTLGEELITDFSPEDSVIDKLIVLRDFQTTGDAIRIRLPYIPEDEFPQYLWIENHNTEVLNGSPFDVFQYQDRDCIENALPGLYAFIQVSHEQTEGKDIFKGYADFIRPLPASGNYDIQWGDTMVQNPWCVNNAVNYPFIRLQKFANPLSGNNVAEFVAIDLNNDDFIGEKEKRDLNMEKIGSSYNFNLPYLGEEEFAYRLDYNKGISIDGNPSSVNVLTFVNDDKDILNGGKPNNRIIYINGLSVEIVSEDCPSPGDVLVRVRSNNHLVENDIRWCAPEIILPDMPEEFDLVIEKRVTLTLDFGQTPTRIDSVISYEGRKYFNSPTYFKVMPGAKILMKKKSKIILRNQSILHILPGAEIIMEDGAAIIPKEGSKVINEGEVREQ